MSTNTQQRTFQAPATCSSTPPAMSRSRSSATGALAGRILPIARAVGELRLRNATRLELDIGGGLELDIKINVRPNAKRALKAICGALDLEPGQQWDGPVSEVLDALNSKRADRLPVVGEHDLARNLARLARLHPGRVRPTTTTTGRVWSIVAPEA